MVSPGNQKVGRFYQQAAQDKDKGEPGSGYGDYDSNDPAGPGPRQAGQVPYQSYYDDYEGSNKGAAHT